MTSSSLKALVVCQKNDRGLDATFSIANPSIQQLRDFLYRLDGGQTLGLDIISPNGSLLISSSVEGRMYVQFAGDSPHVEFGWLLDKSISSDREIEFLLSNGEVDTHPIYETVTREKAFEVASYFLEFDTFPEGLSWGTPDQRT